MYKLVLFLGLTVSTTFAAQSSPSSPLYSRQLVPIPCSEQGEKDCGTGCIPLTYTCCPDRAGGCPASAVCWLGTNGRYGCCPLGLVCDGPGGASTRASTITSTITRDVTIGSTSTSTQTVGPPAVSTTSTSTTSTPIDTTTSTSTSTSSSASTTSFTYSPTSGSNSTATTTSRVIVNAAGNGYVSPMQVLGALAAAVLAI
jgi:hypothetical protein